MSSENYEVSGSTLNLDLLTTHASYVFHILGEVSLVRKIEQFKTHLPYVPPISRVHHPRTLE
jgi:hypothetical protein